MKVKSGDSEHDQSNAATSATWASIFPAAEHNAIRSKAPKSMDVDATEHYVDNLDTFLFDEEIVMDEGRVCYRRNSRII